MPGLAEVPYFTNATIMHVDFLPEHLIIVGGSYIGLEFAQMYRRFGSRVTVIEMGPRLIGREDEDVCRGDPGHSRRRGHRLPPERRVPRRGRARATASPCSMSCAEEPREIAGSHVLLAVGRVPNTGDLGLDRAGVATDARGYITVDDQLRTNVPGIWALGDANGRGAFTHTSYNDYEIVAANLLDGQSRRVTDRITTYALFTDPPLGRAGMTLREVRASRSQGAGGDHAHDARGPRARARRDAGVHARARRRADRSAFSGAALLGIEGDEVVQSLLDAMYAGAPYTVIQQAVHIHPTVAELIPTLLGSLEPLLACSARPCGRRSPAETSADGLRPRPDGQIPRAPRPAGTPRRRSRARTSADRWARSGSPSKSCSMRPRKAACDMPASRERAALAMKSEPSKHSASDGRPAAARPAPSKAPQRPRGRDPSRLPCP